MRSCWQESLAESLLGVGICAIGGMGIPGGGIPGKPGGPIPGPNPTNTTNIYNMYLTILKMDNINLKKGLLDMNRHR